MRSGVKPAHVTTSVYKGIKQNLLLKNTSCLSDCQVRSARK